MKKPIKLIICIATIFVVLFCISFGCGCNNTKSDNICCEHVKSDWINDKKPTLKTEGSKHIECVKCGQILDTQSIPKLCNHIEGDWIVDVKPTGSSVGSKHIECQNCGEILRTEQVPKIECTLLQVKESIKQSIVKVYCYDYDGKTLMSQGSGFFIDNSGTFITNAHVVKDTYYIKIKTSFGVTYDVNIMYVYNYNGSDHAICKAQNCYSSAPVTFAEKASVGDIVYAFGYPNDAFSLSATQGIITSTSVVDKGQTFIENTAEIDHGSSGGVLTNTNGEVIGITTGILDNNLFAALSYSEFKADASKKQFGTKEPLEWFHTVKEISITAYNIDKYFDVIVQGRKTSETSVKYDILLKIKNKYAYEKFVIDSSSISISINLKTCYEWKEVVSYGTANRSQTTSDYISIVFFSESEMIYGKSASSSSSIFISSFKDYYNMDVSYDVVYSSAFGKIIIYNPSSYIY